MTHFKGSVPSQKPQEASGFKRESGEDNQRNQNTFKKFHENWALYVSVNYRTTIISKQCHTAPFILPMLRMSGSKKKGA